MQRSVNDKSRLEAIDFARGAALVAMAIYHFAWDLEFFGYAPVGMTASGGWRVFARCIASSFLFLVGVSLVLAHARGVRWPPFLKRIAMVGVAAAAISLVTWIAVPGGFIFFGILHQITLASLLGIAFLRLPPTLVILIGAFVIAAPQFMRSAAFDHPSLWWVGLSSTNPRSNDYVPLFPWFGVVLLGIAAGRIASEQGLIERFRSATLPPWTRLVQKAGQYSLAFYLIHQPILIGAIWLFSQVIPPSPAPRDMVFMQACNAQCVENQSVEFCSVYCVCMLDRLERAEIFDQVYEGRPDEQSSQRLQDFVEACSYEAEFSGEDNQ